MTTCKWNWKCTLSSEKVPTGFKSSSQYRSRARNCCWSDQTNSAWWSAGPEVWRSREGPAQTAECSFWQHVRAGSRAAPPCLGDAVIVVAGPVRTHWRSGDGRGFVGRAGKLQHMHHPNVEYVPQTGKLVSCKWQRLLVRSHPTRRGLQRGWSSVHRSHIPFCGLSNSGKGSKSFTTRPVNTGRAHVHTN